VIGHPHLVPYNNLMARFIPLLLVCLMTMTMTATGPLDAQTTEPIRYTLRFPAPHTHYVEVEAVYPTAGRAQTELFMAVWTPGSYLIREYERHVENVTAKTPDGRARPVQKTRKNRWSIETAGAPSVTVSYRVYGREMTVRNNWIETGFAMLNGAPTFLTLADRATRPHEVRIELPASWKSVATPLIPVPGRSNTFRAEDFDTVVDSPIIAGNPVIRELEVGGKRHYLVFEGDPSLFDVDRAAADVKKIVEAGGSVMGRYDYPHYYFLNMVTEAGGGLEHKNSFLGMASRFTTRTHRAYLGWLGLIAHEYFHNWNIKRLRPIELGPFDYENEVHTRSLWIAEGFTDYYGFLLLRRAALSTRDEYLEELSNQIEQVQTTPGRLVTPVGMASFDTWIKQYRPDENTANTTVNYYPKGALIAFLLDAKIRKATNGAKSLDDAMRLAYSRYSGEKGYTLDQFYQTMSEAAGIDLKPWFAKVVDTTDELDYTEALEWLGLRFRPVDTRNQRAYLGATTRVDAGRLLVSQVRRGTPVYDAGVNVDDEIVAIDDVRVRPDGMSARLEQYKPGDKASLLVARRDKMIRLDVTLGAEPGRTWRVEVSPAATEAQKQHLASWIGE
jgi:predicted metalloprotease with PDZ domain